MLKEEIDADRRPAMAVFAGGREFLLKYFDRAFDCRITNNPAEAEKNQAFVVMGAEFDESDDIKSFVRECQTRNINVTVLKVPHVIGTGMNGLMLRMARGVARGFHLKIKENEARWSVIHATDIASAALRVANSDSENATFTISAPPVKVNDLQDALSHRIKNKRLGSTKPRWAKIIYGSELYALLTQDKIVDTSDFEAAFPDFVFADPAEYLKTHIYDNDSL